MATLSKSKEIQNVQAWNNAVHIGSGAHSFASVDAPGAGYRPVKATIGETWNGDYSFNIGYSSGNGSYGIYVTNSSGGKGTSIKTGTAAKISNMSSTSGGTSISAFSKTIDATNLTNVAVTITIAATNSGNLYWRGRYTYSIEFSNNYKITKTAGEHGTLSGASTADYNTSVTITASPSAGYRVKTLTVSAGSNVTRSGNSITFTMPAQAVTVTAEFELMSTIKYYDGSEWQECYVYYYDGTDWQEVIPYCYDGSEWQECTQSV